MFDFIKSLFSNKPIQKESCNINKITMSKTDETSYKDSQKYQDDLKKYAYEKEFFEKYSYLIDVISYFVKSDDRFTANEKDVVKNYFKKLESNNELLTDAMFDRVFRGFQKYSYQTFQSRVRSFEKNNVITDELFDFLNELISVDKNISDDEKKGIDYMKKLQKPN